MEFWTSSDAPSVVECLVSLEAIPKRDTLSSRAALTAAGASNYRQAATMVSYIQDGAARVDALRNLSASWTFSNPNEAKAWKDRLPPVDQDALEE